MKWYGLSDTGLRRDHNEDAWWIEPERGLAIVADGMGGHAAGEVASGLVVETVCARLPMPAPASGEPALGHLRDAVEAAHQAVLAAAKEDAARQGMGSTALAALVMPGAYHLAHVGDSRAYLLRNGALIRLTRDHTLVEEMVQAGVLTAEEAETSAQRHILRQAIGAELVTVDLYRGYFQDDDVLLLCSDGLHEMVPAARIASILRQYAETPADAAKQLIDAANAVGGEDNITVALVVGDAFRNTRERVSSDTLELTTPIEETPVEKPVRQAKPKRRQPVSGCAIVVMLLALLALGVFAYFSTTYRWNFTGATPRLEAHCCGVTLPTGVTLPAKLGDAKLGELVSDLSDDNATKAYTNLPLTPCRSVKDARAALRVVVVAVIDATLRRTRMVQPFDTIAPITREVYLSRLKKALGIAEAYKPYDAKGMTFYIRKIKATIDALKASPSD